MRRHLFTPRSLTLACGLFAVAVFATHLAVSWSTPIRGSDFNAYLVGAELLRAGADVYTADRSLWEATAEAHGLTPVNFRYRYPIHWAWLLASLPAFDPGWFWLANGVLNGVATLFAALLIGRCLGGGNRTAMALFLAGASGSMVETLVLGQVTGLILFALALGWYALQRRWNGVWVACVALGSVLKLLPAVLLAPAFCARRYRLAAAAAVATALLFLWPVALFGPEHLLRFLFELGDIVTTPGIGENNQSLAVALARWQLAPGWLYPLRVLVLVAVALVAWRQWQAPAALANDRLLGALICAALLLPQTSFFMYQLWTLIPLMQLWADRERAAWLRWGMVGLYLLCQALYVLPQLLPRLWPQLFVASDQVFGWLDEWPLLYTALLLAALSSAAWRGRPAAAPAS